ncbi:MAG: acyl-CoA thioesterase [Oxalicibacterium faecigallinarum]|uniref:acyl-CoA thioesterase n=1 Tax=Oxalicibacterium faecigallinarum TaxID=573741 RepID=UPI002809AB92|nr:acyl-CoA thioesterase [Oxalicibacterium faecigallinarum]MDQ7969653.1 acyl-CoA thioesterase [Oxalicibacterium faecigallinarum]
MNLLWRTLIVSLRARLRRRIRPLAMDDVGRIRLTVLPTDLDVQRHLNNGRYLSLFDLGRWDLATRSGFGDVTRTHGWYSVVTAETITFRKSLRLWQRFVLETRLVGHDERTLFIEHRAVSDGEVYARAFVRARVLRRRGGAVDVEELFAAAGWPQRDPELDPWVNDWASASALPPSRVPVPSVWP